MTRDAIMYLAIGHAVAFALCIGGLCWLRKLEGR